MPVHTMKERKKKGVTRGKKGRIQKVSTSDGMMIMRKMK